MPTPYGSRSFDNNQMLGNVVKGAVAGAAAVWVMDRIDWFLFRRESPRTRRHTRRARPGGMDPAHVAAQRVAKASDNSITPQDSNLLGKGIHYDLGIIPGALYGVLRDYVPQIRSGHGSLWGLAMFLLQDEVLNSVLGLSGKPRDYPWQAHLRGLVSHLFYGITLDTSLQTVKRIVDTEFQAFQQRLDDGTRGKRRVPVVPIEDEPKVH